MTKMKLYKVRAEVEGYLLAPADTEGLELSGLVGEACAHLIDKRYSDDNTWRPHPNTSLVSPYDLVFHQLDGTDAVDGSKLRELIASGEVVIDE